MPEQPSDFFNFTKKVVLVTGGGSGLGAGIARRFAQTGASIVVNYHSSADAAVKLIAQITASGGQSAAVHADVTNPAAVEQLIWETIAHFGTLSDLHNANASRKATSE